MKRILLAVCIGMLSGCATVTSEAEGEKGIQAISCSAIGVSQDCKLFGFMAPGLARREVVIDGLKFRVAASDDGQRIYIETSTKLSTDPETASDAVRAVRLHFDSLNIGVLSVNPVYDVWRLLGYVMEMDADGYSHLLKFSSGN